MGKVAKQTLNSPSGKRKKRGHPRGPRARRPQKEKMGGQKKKMKNQEVLGDEG